MKESQAGAHNATIVYEVGVTPEGFGVLRNRVLMRTPVGHNLILPTQGLADAIVAEWRLQKDRIIPSTMPMMRLAATSLDITSKDRPKIIEHILAYASSELLCHRVETPRNLAVLQHTIWQPFLDWCDQRFGVQLMTGVGIMPITQKQEVVERLRQNLEARSDWFLTGLHYAVDCCGSLVLGLALAEKHTSVEPIFDAAELDTTFQMEKWGEPSAIQQRRQRFRQDLDEAAKWFALF